MSKFTFSKGLAAVLLGIAPSLYAANENVGVKLLKENFSYSLGKLSDQAPGVWSNYLSYFSSAKGDSVQVVENSLTYAGYEATSIGNSVQLKGEGPDISRTFSSVDGSIYVSFLVNVKEALANTDNKDLVFALGDRTNISMDGFGPILVKNVGGKLSFGMSRKVMSAPQWTEPNYDFNTTYLLVVKYVPVSGKTNDVAALFINPDISGSEPVQPTITGLKGNDPNSILCTLNLYQGKANGKNVQVDALRLATSWEALFNNTEVVKWGELFAPATEQYVGDAIVGGGTEIKSINIKGKELTGDITIKFSSEGYIRTAKTTITKAEAEAENGFDLNIYLKPKDDLRKKDTLVFTCGNLIAKTPLKWTLSDLPTPEAYVDNIADVKNGGSVCYQLMNSVTVTKIDDLGNGIYGYTIEDASGSMFVTDNKSVLTNKVKVGERPVNLCVFVSGQSEYAAERTFFITDSPSLIIDKPATGIKLFTDNFNYSIGSLVGKASKVWINHDCFYTGGKDSVMIVEGNLTMEGYQPKAVGKSVQLMSKGKDATAPFPAMAGTIYTSMLINVKAAPAAGDYFLALGDKNNSSTEGFGKIHIKSTDGKLAFGITRKSMSDNATWTAAEYELNKTYLLILKYTQVEGESNDVVALFVNPDVAGSEPTSFITNDQGGDPSANLAALNLYQGRDLGNDLIVDAIRVATSWEALFDHAGVANVPEIMAKSNFYIGNFMKGDDPIIGTLNVKAKNLKEDITVSFASEGYITIPSKTISKAQAESAEGFNLVITLNPKDGQISNETLKFTSGIGSTSTGLSWSYSEPDPEVNAESISIANGALQRSYFTLINDVEIIKIDTLGRGMIAYTLKDASGTLEAIDTEMVLRSQVELKSKVKNLRLFADGEPESDTFKPIFSIKESKELIITPPTTIENINNKTITGYANGEFIAEGASSIGVYDVCGKVLSESNSDKINISSLSGSIFIIRYTDGAGINHSVKLVK